MSPRQSVVSNDPRVMATQQARRAGAAWSELPGGQRVLGVVVVLAMLVGGVAFVQWQRTPSYGPLFTGMSAASGGAVVEELQASGVTYRLADGGATVLVPSDQVYDLRLQMSAAGLPGDDTGGYSLLDDQGVTASQFQQEVAYQRAMEGELAKTIGAIGGVDAAVVHLAVPKKDVFLDEAAAPSASVLVQTATGRDLDKGQVQAVVNLVSSSVEGLTPDAVTVVDQNGRMLSAAGGAGAAGGGAEAGDMTAEFERRVAGDLQNLLDTVVGPGKAVATVTAALDFDQAEATTERFLAPEEGVLPLSESIDTEEYTGAGGANEAGVLGPDNIVVPNGVVGGADSAYSSENRTVNNAVGKVTERVVAAPGDVERLSVSVVVDRDAVARADMLALQDTVSAAVGLDAARGDTVSVTQLPFSVGDAEAIAAELEAAQEAEAAATQQQMIWNAVLAGLVLLVIIVTLVMGLRRKKRREPVDLGLYAAPEDDEPVDLPLPPAPRAEALPAAPDPEAGQLAVLTRQRDEVIDLVDREPAEVAELLRSWLADRRTS